MSTGVDAQTCKLVVLDQNIQSMTKFKQIIGRGTRINEKYGKLWFTILDFKKATELFADERFDGVPEKVIRTTPQDITDPESDFDHQLEDETPEHELPDLINGVAETPAIYGPTSGNGSGVFEEDDENKIRKFHVNGVTVKVLAKRVQYYDADGKLVTESFQTTPAKRCSKIKTTHRLMTSSVSGTLRTANSSSLMSLSSSACFGMYWPKRWGKISTRSICCAT